MAAKAASLPDRTQHPRIVHCFRSPVGGIFRHVRDLVRAQAAAGSPVGIVCDSSTGGAREEELFREIEPHLELGLHRFPMQRQVSPTDFMALARLFRRIKALDPDVLHTHGAKGGVYGRVIGTLLRVSGSRVARIYCPHGGSLHYDARSRSGRIYFRLERWMEQMTDAFVFVSQYEADTYAAKVGKPCRPFRIAPNGITDDEFVPLETAPDAADFLYIGMMRDLKGPDLFLHALARIRDETGTAPSAILVGDGPDMARYISLAERLGLAAKTKFRPAMPARQAFVTAHVVVVPSRAESMPYIVLEAVAAGRPLVASRVGGIPEIFGGEGHRLVPPGEIGPLAAAMIETGRDRRAALEQAAALSRAIRPRFSVEAMAEVVGETYREARGSGKGRG